SPNAPAIASTSVDFPAPFSPTSTVIDVRSKPSSSTWRTGAIVAGHLVRSRGASGCSSTRRTGSLLNAPSSVTALMLSGAAPRPQQPASVPRPAAQQCPARIAQLRVLLVRHERPAGQPRDVGAGASRTVR